MIDSQLQALISAIEQADSPARLIGAVRALAAARLESGIPTLIQALGYNNPGAAIAAVDGLVQLGVLAVEPLLEQIDGYNYGARAYAIRALAAIADPRALEVLLSAAATDFAPSVRRAAAKGLGSLQWQYLPAQQCIQAQVEALNVLLEVSEDSDWAIRYAAVVGLQGLGESAVAPKILHAVSDRLHQMQLADGDLATQARAKFACDRLAAISNPQLPVYC
ncbi:MAG: HEAT repeat domain-containing protein [Oscillatoriales cyanobacterium C42_A2020_001]|nr:HEAT repeat domain-containing protein [Leptolyngbyaceae cyanobacterium C42_A2020_001]